MDTDQPNAADSDRVGCFKFSGRRYAGVYADKALTGTKAERPEFQRLLADCRAGKIDMVITKSISRFARNTVTLLETVRELKALGVDVYFQEQNIHSTSGDGELMLTILASYAQEESRSVSENCKWRIRKNYERGAAVPILTYGYSIVEGKPEINPDEATVVRLIFEKHNQGMGLWSIAQMLDSLGIKPPYAQRWGALTIRYILRNERYVGDLLLQKTFISDHLSKKKRINRGELPRYYVSEIYPAIISRDTFERSRQLAELNTARFTPINACSRYYVEGSHPAIIEPEIFDAVQIELKRRKMPGRRNYTPHCFSDRIYCDECGEMYGSKMWHFHTVWKCNAKHKGLAACATPALRNETIQDAFVQAFNQVIDRKDEIIQICEDTMRKRCDTSGLAERLAELRTELEIITELMQRHISANAHTAIDQAEYQRQYDEYEARFHEAQWHIAEAEAHREALTAKRGKLKGYLDILRQQGTIRTFNETLWCGAVEQMRILKDGTMRFIFKDGAVVEG